MQELEGANLVTAGPSIRRQQVIAPVAFGQPRKPVYRPVAERALPPAPNLVEQTALHRVVARYRRCTLLPRRAAILYAERRLDAPTILRFVVRIECRVQL